MGDLRGSDAPMWLRIHLSEEPETATAASPEIAAAAGIHDARIAGIVTEIVTHPSHPYTVAALAARAAMSRSAFAAAFSAELGMPPMAFVRDVRLRRAAALLASTALPVSAVAHRVGFAGRSHFSRAFHALYGVSPAGFRSQAENR